MTVNPDDIVVLCNRVEDGPERRRRFHQGNLLPMSSASVAVAGHAGHRGTRGEGLQDPLSLCGEARLRDNPSPDDKLMMPSVEQIREIVKSLANPIDCHAVELLHAGTDHRFVPNNRTFVSPIPPCPIFRPPACGRGNPSLLSDP